jgi:nucleolar protein 56
MSSTSFYVLFESSSGWGLFEVIESEEIGAMLQEVQRGVQDFSRFQRAVKLSAFSPFQSAESALENMTAITEHELSPDLRNFLDNNLAKNKKSRQFPLGVIDAQLGTAIQENLSISCRSDETVREVIRGIRYHFTNYVKLLGNGMLEQAQLGLGHSYSRTKVKFNPGRADTMIIQSIALLDQLDKDINTFAMRVREWYSWHFPELKQIVSDNFVFARSAAYIKDKSQLSEEHLAGLTEIVGEEAISQRILKAARSSMGMDTSEQDMSNILIFTERMISLALYRKQLYSYLEEKMALVAPNLSTLVGETVAARLIQKAGSLTSLAKCPASTVQILGAEKALFRALKTKGNTPKYGLIYHSSFIGRASTKNKGRISRYLANKCSIASRIDSFIDEPTKAYGEQLRMQVEERLNFYDTGETPRKNVDVMTSVSQSLRSTVTPASSKKASKSAPAMDVEEDDKESDGKKKKEKKEKKDKKDKKRSREEDEAEDEGEKKKKKKNKKDE